MHIFRPFHGFIFFAVVTLGGVGGCSSERSKPAPSEPVIEVETGKVLKPSSDCLDGLIGMKVCDEAYWWGEYACGRDACLDWGNDLETSIECGMIFMDTAIRACDTIRAQ